ncbi:MAG: energy-coupling factor transporter transmembrane protein EcfT [Eubacteriaceae bacterium]|nr:energy-coupling factor transporter transmembrane protein EcfT [Eubacteriaceae bacterium]
MIKDITIGQYYPTDSVLHRLDARTKLLSTLAYIIFLFLVKNVWGYLAAFVFLAVCMILSKIPIGYVLRGLKAVVFILCLTVLINLFFTPGDVIWSYGVMKITEQGARMAFNVAFRLLLLISATSLMTLCTDTISLTDGMEELMRKVPLVRRYAHELSMMMSIALRFIPTLSDETERIMKAQKSRGADFESGNIIRRAKALIPILVPLFVSAFQRASELAMAMEARCYRGAEGRTRLKELHYSKADIVAYCIVILALAGIWATRYIPAP